MVITPIHGHFVDRQLSLFECDDSHICISGCEQGFFSWIKHLFGWNVFIYTDKGVIYVPIKEVRRIISTDHAADELVAEGLAKIGHTFLSVLLKQSTTEQGSQPGMKDLWHIHPRLSGGATCSWDDMMSLYEYGATSYAPRENNENLKKYFLSEDYKCHAATARVYYKKTELAEEDALRIAYQREPANIGGDHLYDTEKCHALLGYRYGVFYDKEAMKVDGRPYYEAPNTICLYSETYLWDPPGGDAKKEVAIFSVPAPALDSPTQPQFQYYMKLGQLDEERYKAEISFLFRSIEAAICENHAVAFQGKGFKRILISRFGQGNFLNGVEEARLQASHIFDNEYKKFVNRMADLKIQICQSEFSKKDASEDQEIAGVTVLGDIVCESKEGDFIVNAWDPHSAVGNGNDNDYSYDGALGRASGMLVTDSAWFNESLRSTAVLRAVA
jgi:hypothetical protein